MILHIKRENTGKLNLLSTHQQHWLSPEIVKQKKTKKIPPPSQLGVGMRNKIEFIPICKYFPLKCPFSPGVNWTELLLPAKAGKPVSMN